MPLLRKIFPAACKAQKSFCAAAEAHRWLFSTGRAGHQPVLYRRWYKENRGCFQPGAGSAFRAAACGKLDRPTGIQHIWGYLFLGFGLLTSIKWLYTFCWLLLHKYLYSAFQNRWQYTVFSIAFQLISCMALWSVLKWVKLFSRRYAGQPC